MESSSVKRKALKRLLADIPEDVFWDIKTEATARRLKMNEVLPLAVSKFLKLDVSVEQLGLDPQLQKYLDDDEEVRR